MKREALFTKIVAMLLCAMLVVGYLPVAAFATDWEGDIDVVEPDPGSEEAPIALTALENTVTVPAGSAMYYTSRHNGMIMTVTGTTGYEVLVGEESTADTEGVVTMNVVCASTYEPMTFAVVNNTEADVEYSIVFTYPEGSMENPKVAALYDQTVSVEAGDTDGYYLTYVADYTGKLSIAVSVAETVSGWAYSVNNMTTYAYGEMLYSNDDPVVNPYLIDVTAGDEIQIIVNTFNPDDQWNSPAGDVTVSINYVAGSCPEFPIFLGQMENSVTNAGTVYYQGYFSGTIMTVSGEGDFTVTYNGEDIAAVEGVVSIPVSTSNPRMPVEFSVTGDGAYTINFAYPVGHANNPLVAVLGDNTASVEAGNTAGFLMTYTADYTGTLLVELSGVDGWSYTINNMTTYTYGDTQWSDSEPVVNPAEIAVTAGDELQIIVNTYNPDDMWNTPAGEINVNLSYKQGSCPEAAIFLGQMENSVTNEGTVYYQGYFTGTIMTVSGEGEFSVVYNGETIAAVDGVVSIPVSSANPRMPIEFSVIGDGAYTINFAYPAGSQANPDVAVLGDNVASVEAGSQGYYYTYTAEQAGDLIVTVSADAGWTYVINNMTTGSYGDTQWSDSDPVVNPATITVAEGDELQIIVCTYDAANPWTAPAGDVTVNLAYDAPATPEVQIKFASANMILEADLTFTFWVKPEVMAQYEDIRVEYVIGDKTLVVTESWLNPSNSRSGFNCTGIAPNMIKDTVQATIYGTYDGVEYNFSMEHSAYKYLTGNSILGSDDASLRTLAVDLLNYGTIHQLYTGYKTDALINADLTDDQKANGTSTVPTLTNIASGTQEVVDNPTAKFNSANLILENAVIMRWTLTCDDLTDVSVKIKVAGNEYVVDASEFEAAPGYTNRYYIYCTKLTAIQFREPVDATIYRGETAISNTLRYSVESYAASKQNDTSIAYLADIVKAIMVYGDAAYAYIFG